MRNKVIVWTLSALAGVALLFAVSLDTLISLGVEDVVGSMTGVAVRCGPTDFSLLEGRGAVSGLAIENPSGFSAQRAVSIARTSFSVDKSTIFSRAVVIPELVLENPLILFEPGPTAGEANVDALLAHVRASAAQALAGRPAHDIRLAIGELTVRGARVKVVIAGLAEPVPDIAVPDIVLTGLGTGTDGISGEAVFEIVFNAVHEAVRRQIESFIPGLAAPDSPAERDTP